MLTSIVILAIGVISLSSTLGLVEKQHHSKCEKMKYSCDLMDRFSNTIDSLEDWENEKPFLYHGVCPYARELIFEQLRLMEELASLGYPEYNDLEYIETLHELLARIPPPINPSFCDGFVFIKKIIKHTLLLQAG
mgnify:CR=1 FL=1